VRSFSFLSLPQAKELTTFITDYLQEAYIPMVNGEHSTGFRFTGSRSTLSKKDTICLVSKPCHWLQMGEAKREQVVNAESL
jgi:hypothetical protein